MKRRDFLKLTALGTAALATGLSRLDGAAPASGTAADAFPPVPVYRTLGRTKLQVTIVGFGAMLTPEPEVIGAGIDMGINYLDTARVYMNGRNEEIVGKALTGRRDKVILATKTKGKSVTPEAIIDDVETSLASLKTDHIDIIQLHNVTNANRDRLLDRNVRAALAGLRKEGKVRFFGVTTHTDQADVINAVVDDPDKFFDTVLVAYNFQSPPELKTAIARAASAGIGIIAMKTQMGGYQVPAGDTTTQHQAALRWVLADTNVATTIPGMRDMAMLKEDLSVMGMKLSSADIERLERYSKAVSGYYCRLCARCEPTCPNRVAISVVNRSLMYAEGYGSLELARATYDGLDPEATARTCAGCPGCVATCAHGLDIASRMSAARALLG
ncbi:MAG TPA: aldo/keto reductase [Candidatus Ozemobacteraceae bacterium]|nr:aldo/keto reductase [Candidatus Ozemobacteraceae bacterium]